MARPKAEFPPADAIRALADTQGCLMVRVTPGARCETIEIAGGRLLVKVRAKPQDGAANDAVLAILAKALGSAPSCITLLRGATSRQKQLRIEDWADQ